jgi:hypothetical protein
MIDHTGFHPHGIKQHATFVARSRAEVDAFYTAGPNAGGTRFKARCRRLRNESK